MKEKNQQNNMNHIKKDMMKWLSPTCLISTYIAFCLTATGISLAANKSEQNTFTKTRAELLDNHTALDPTMRTILIKSDSAYFATQKYNIGIRTPFPIITIKRNTAEMIQAFLEPSKPYIQQIIKENNIQTLDDAHAYMQTISYKYDNDKDNRPNPPALIAHQKEGDCDDQTHLCGLILNELGFKSGKVPVIYKETGEGHALMVIQFDPHNSEHAAFISKHGLEQKIHLGADDKAYLFYETTMKNTSFFESCLSPDIINERFELIEEVDGGSFMVFQ